MLVGSIVIGSIAGYFAAGAALILGHTFLVALVTLLAVSAAGSLFCLAYTLIKPVLIARRRDPHFLAQELE